MWQLLKAEFLKFIKLRFWLYLTGIVLLFVLGFLFLELQYSTEELQKLVNLNGNNNAWFTLKFSTVHILIGFVLVPFTALLIPFYLDHVEERNQGWKRLLLLPISIESVHFSRLIIGVFYYAIFLAFLYGCFNLSLSLIPYLRPELYYDPHNTYSTLLAYCFVKYFEVGAALIIVYYLLLFVIRNFYVKLLLTIFIPLIFPFIHFPFNPITILNRLVFNIIHIRVPLAKKGFHEAAVLQKFSIIDSGLLYMAILILLAILGLQFLSRNKRLHQWVIKSHYD